MTRSAAYLELIDSQLPALQLLINMGWEYLPPGEALRLREEREKEVRRYWYLICGLFRLIIPISGFLLENPSTVEQHRGE
jgi:hypothetical protein